MSGSIGLRPFWRYYGGKWRMAPRYPTPEHPTIVELFAGAAGYSLRYPDRKVILVERYGAIAEIWRYLIRTGPLEILSIPDVFDVADLPSGTPEGARLLVGFAMNRAASTPRRTCSAEARAKGARHHIYTGWTQGMRARVASQVDAIRHWRIIEGDYTAAPNVRATWFIDSPYRGRAGAHYVHGSSKIDYPALGEWCRARRGQRIVCEAEGADWLPFRPFGITNGIGGRKSREAVWP